MMYIHFTHALNKRWFKRIYMPFSSNIYLHAYIYLKDMCARYVCILMYYTETKKNTISYNRISPHKSPFTHAHFSMNLKITHTNTTNSYMDITNKCLHVHMYSEWAIHTYRPHLNLQPGFNWWWPTSPRFFFCGYIVFVHNCIILEINNGSAKRKCSYFF